jgi:rare lipoprotein A (peptidoglycan hydrolase)
MTCLLRSSLRVVSLAAVGVLMAGCVAIAPGDAPLTPAVATMVTVPATIETSTVPAKPSLPVTPPITPVAFTPAPAPVVAPRAVPVAVPVAVTRPTPVAGRHHELDGLASYYWQDQMTASGERFNKNAMTAAHRTLPLGTRVRVTHLASGRAVTVRINDRGPFKPGRVIDLSEAAAKELQMTAAGLAMVRVEVVK